MHSASRRAAGRRRPCPRGSRATGPPRPPPTFPAWRYGRALARLNPVDPEKIHALWEVTDATAKRAEGRAGKLAARLQRIESGGAKTVALHEGVFAVQT